MQDDSNPYRSPQATDSLAPRLQAEAGPRAHRSDKLRIMAWMLVLFVLTGCVSSYASDDRGNERAISLVSGLLFGALCVRWCHYDGLERGRQGWRYLAATMLLCPGPLLMFPLYFLRTRGFSQGMLASLGALGFLFVLLGAYTLTFFVLAFLA